MKRILATLALTVLFANTVFAATPQSADDILDSKASATIDFTLKGKLKDFINATVGKEIQSFQESANQSDSSEDMRIAKLLIAEAVSGDRVSLAYSEPNAAEIVMSTTDSMWSDVTKNMKTVSYHDMSYYFYSDVFVLRVGNFMVLTNTEDGVKAVIDRLSTDSALSKSPTFSKLAAVRPSDRAIGMTFNFDSIKGQITGAANNFNFGTTGSDESTLINNAFGFLDTGALSVSETPTGYAFGVKVVGNEKKITDAGVSFNPTGSFVPRLYKMLPDAAPIYYGEGYNLKAAQDNSQKTIQAILGADGAAFNREFERGFLDSTGVDLAAFENLFTKEYAFALQTDIPSIVPYFTFAADVSENRIAADPLIQKTLEKLAETITKEAGPMATVTLSPTHKGLTVSVDLSSMPEVSQVLHLNQISISMGLTDDNLFVISNYPNILNVSSHKGFANNPDFMAFSQVKSPVQSINYINARNFWHWADALLEAAGKVESNALVNNIKDLKDYYSAVGLMYPWKDTLLVTNGTRTDSTVQGWITIDGAQHQTFAQYISALKAEDTDNDGASNFDERFVYHTSETSKDCDRDGVSDTDELKAGFDPCTGNKPVFKDFSGSFTDTMYYSDAVVRLKKGGIVSGYPDGTFGPGKTVTRAEFVQMVMKAFDHNSFGAWSSKSYYTDVRTTDWFFDAVQSAYDAGIISSGSKTFRPADPITRSEALMILNRASVTLNKTLYSSSCKGTFNDVHSTDWFCNAVANGKTHGITAGRSAGRFEPMGKLTRAEGAVMILKAMNLDIQDSVQDDGVSDSWTKILNGF